MRVPSLEAFCSFMNRTQTFDWTDPAGWSKRWVEESSLTASPPRTCPLSVASHYCQSYTLSPTAPEWPGADALPLGACTKYTVQPDCASFENDSWFPFALQPSCAPAGPLFDNCGNCGQFQILEDGQKNPSQAKQPAWTPFVPSAGWHASSDRLDQPIPGPGHSEWSTPWVLAWLPCCLVSR
ncbi:hypothetical protein MRS44_003057 [Fusarium solani]|uniref:uncharacterized protein n=1 Tax=Fusarium solani TaxID=169388 RepID=UPI0032C3FF46|nr:hypothetical protein MRS44_003057 [Fusarium solani]